MISKNHQYWMKKAIALAKKSGTAFGAVVVGEKHQHLEAFNTTSRDGATAHAEMNVLQKLKNLDYEDSRNLILYTTVEPCPMCMSAIVWVGIGTVVYGASIEEASQYGRQIDITSQEVVEKSWYNITLINGIERENCLQLFKM